MSDSWYHVANRGIARRTVFESDRDMRWFLFLLATAVRQGLLEVHAFVLMMTHFHLFVRDRGGQLQKAMQWVEARYVEHFNRLRGRDGTLFRGRFWAGRVEGLDYARHLVSYVHENPVVAGLVARAEDYQFSSAAYYSNVTPPPPWLTTSMVVGECLATRPRTNPADSAWIVGRGAFSRHTALGVPVGVEPWMIANSALADGTRPGAPIVGPLALQAVLDAEVGADKALIAGLWRTACGLKQHEIAERLRTSPASAMRLLAMFRARVAADPSFLTRVAGLIARAMA